MNILEAEYRSINKKLREFEAQGREFSTRMASNPSPTLQEIEAYRVELNAYFEENLDSLKKMAENSRSSYSRELAQLQLDYIANIDDFFEQLETTTEVEAHLLHSEFSIDLAKQSMIYALLCSLQSIEKSERKRTDERN